MLVDFLENPQTKVVNIFLKKIKKLVKNILEIAHLIYK